MAVHHILFYDYVEDMVGRRVPHRDAHLLRIAAGREAGQIVMAGALGDPPRRAAIVFGDVEREVIESFVAADPYVIAGLVTRWRVELWNVV
jgi:uncharacterized protein YciI